MGISSGKKYVGHIALPVFWVVWKEMNRRILRG